MLHDGTWTDTVLFLSTGEEISVHKTILASSSKVFRRALGLEIKKVRLRIYFYVLWLLTSRSGCNSYSIFL